MPGRRTTRRSNRPSTAGLILFWGTLLAYFSRPWSCSNTLGQFSLTDDVPYAHFDYHGFGVLLAWLLAIGFALAVLGLAGRIFLRPGVKLGFLRSAEDRRVTYWSVLIAAAFAVPMHSQLSYLLGLPERLTWPVVWSSLAWLVAVEAARTAAISGDNVAVLLDGIGRRAAGLAGLIAVPKLILMTVLLGG